MENLLRECGVRPSCSVWSAHSCPLLCITPAWEGPPQCHQGQGVPHLTPAQNYLWASSWWNPDLRGAHQHGIDRGGKLQFLGPWKPPWNQNGWWQWPKQPHLWLSMPVNTSQTPIFAGTDSPSQHSESPGYPVLVMVNSPPWIEGEVQGTKLH